MVYVAQVENNLKFSHNISAAVFTGMMHNYTNVQKLR